MNGNEDGYGAGSKKPPLRLTEDMLRRAFDDAVAAHDELRPDVLSIRSIAMADYLIDRGYLDNTNCILMCGGVGVYKHIERRLAERRRLAL